jgi:hypothetical protein
MAESSIHVGNTYDEITRSLEHLVILGVGGREGEEKQERRGAY